MFIESPNGSAIDIGILCMVASVPLSVIPFFWTMATPLAIIGAGLFVGGSIQMPKKTRSKKQDM